MIVVYALFELYLTWFGIPNSEDRWTTTGILSMFLLAVAGVWFVQIFTEPVAESAGLLEKHRRLKRHWMAFAYGFMVSSLAAAVVPFTFDIMPLNDRLLKAPISVFPGCVESAVPGENARVAELSCRKIEAGSAVADAAELAATTTAGAAKLAVNFEKLTAASSGAAKSPTLATITADAKVVDTVAANAKVAATVAADAAKLTATTAAYVTKLTVTKADADKLAAGAVDVEKLTTNVANDVKVELAATSVDAKTLSTIAKNAQNLAASAADVEKLAAGAAAAEKSGAASVSGTT